MQFSNPTTVPSSFTVIGGSVDTVTTYVPTITRDVYYWPCIAGEALAPARNAATTYASKTSKACLVNGTATVGAIAATWPAVSRVGADQTKTTLTFKWKYRPDVRHVGAFGSGVPMNFQYGASSTNTVTNLLANPGLTTRQVGVYYNDSTHSWHLYTFDGNATATDDDTHVDYTLGDWIQFTLVITTTSVSLTVTSSTGSATVIRNGIVWPATIADSPTLTPVWMMSNSTDSINAGFTEFQASYA